MGAGPYTVHPFAPCSRQIITQFLQATCSSWRTANSIKALKATLNWDFSIFLQSYIMLRQISITQFPNFLVCVRASLWPYDKFDNLLSLSANFLWTLHFKLDKPCSCSHGASTFHVSINPAGRGEDYSWGDIFRQRLPAATAWLSMGLLPIQGRPYCQELHGMTQTDGTDIQTGAR